MIIKLQPQRSDKILTVSKSADVLTINGTAYDFSVIPDGATLPASAVNCEFVVDVVERISGTLRITLLLPHGVNPSQAVAFPSPIINPVDGVLELPQ